MFYHLVAQPLLTLSATVLFALAYAACADVQNGEVERSGDGDGLDGCLGAAGDVCAPTWLTCDDLDCALRDRACLDGGSAADARCGDCLSSFVDRAGLCVAHFPLGDVCAAGDTCASGFCGNGRCAPSGFSYVPAGTFTMGATAGEEVGAGLNETPHEVELTRAFFLQQTEVTQGQWRELMGTSPSYFSSCGDDCPVESVSWWDALAYLNALSRSDGLDPCYDLSGCTGVLGGGCRVGTWCNDDYTCRAVDFAGLDCEGYRLPTESEWEYSARAGTTTATYLGDLQFPIDCDPQPNLEPIAWYCENAGGTPHAAGGLDPNAWGLYDMLGNVWEWTWDCYRWSYPGATTDPVVASEGPSRVIRGGSWSRVASSARAANRYDHPPDVRYTSLGFRVARTVP